MYQFGEKTRTKYTIRMKIELENNNAKPSDLSIHAYKHTIFLHLNIIYAYT